MNVAVFELPNTHLLSLLLFTDGELGERQLYVEVDFGKCQFVHLIDLHLLLLVDPGPDECVKNAEEIAV